MSNAGNFERRKIKSFNEKQFLFSIGIYRGRSPFELSQAKNIPNPVVSRQNVSDAKALFVADPFMLKVGKTWYMFFEVYNGNTGKGEIGLAKSANSFEWFYEKIG